MASEVECESSAEGVVQEFGVAVHGVLALVEACFPPVCCPEALLVSGV